MPASARLCPDARIASLIDGSGALSGTAPWLAADTWLARPPGPESFASAQDPARDEASIAEKLGLARCNSQTGEVRWYGGTPRQPYGYSPCSKTEPRSQESRGIADGCKRYRFASTKQSWLFDGRSQNPAR